MGKEEEQSKDKKKRGGLLGVLTRRKDKPEQGSTHVTSLLPSASVVATSLLPGGVGSPLLPSAALTALTPSQAKPVIYAHAAPPPKPCTGFPKPTPESAPSSPPKVDEQKKTEVDETTKDEASEISDVSSMGMDEPMEASENDQDEDEEAVEDSNEQAKNLLRASEWVPKDLYNDDTTDEEEDDNVDEEDLHQLLHKGDWVILKEILLQLKEDEFAIGAALTKLNKKKSTPVHVAVWKAPPALVKLMFELISDSLEEDLFLLTNREGNTILHLACANLDVDHTGKVDLTIIKRLVRGGPDAMAMQNNDGDTPLHLLVATPLCHRDQAKLVATAAKDIVTAFLKLNDDPLLMQDAARATPFHVAIAHKAHERIITRMIDFDPNGIQAAIPDERGMLPLHYIAAFGHVSCEIVKRLIQTYPTSILSVTDDGDTPLHILASNAANYVEPSKSLEHNLTIITVLLLGMNSHVGTSPLLMMNKEDVSTSSFVSLPTSLSR
jgi:ankyrin repeat protein